MQVVAVVIGNPYASYVFDFGWQFGIDVEVLGRVDVGFEGDFDVGHLQTGNLWQLGCGSLEITRIRLEFGRKVVDNYRVDGVDVFCDIVGFADYVPSVDYMEHIALFNHSAESDGIGLSDG